MCLFRELFFHRSASVMTQPAALTKLRRLYRIFIGILDLKINYI